MGSIPSLLKHIQGPLCYNALQKIWYKESVALSIAIETKLYTLALGVGEGVWGRVLLAYQTSAIMVAYLPGHPTFFNINVHDYVKNTRTSGG